MSTDPACAVAHGEPGPARAGTVVAVFASPVARMLLHFAKETGFRTVLVEPDPARVDDVAYADEIRTAPGPDPDADVVVCDHHRDELGTALRDALAVETRWVGVLGNPRHSGPHREALAALGVDPADIARVHRPVGLNIGSRTPAEIAISTLAGLIADRNGRPGGFEFSAAAAPGR